MENLKKIFMFVLVGLFLINFSSAGLFDPNSELAFHEEGKNGKYGYYEINDTTFWIFNNKPVKTIELIENDYSVYTAWNIKELELFKPTKLFDKTNYLDREQKEDRKSLLSSELHFYREWETKTRTINNQSCLTYETSENQTQICSEYQDNSYEEEYEEWSKWKLYNFQTVQEGLYQTKTIVTRSSQGTGPIDWVDENEGWDLDRWFIWWDNDWEFKRQINITETSGSTLVNYSTLLRIPYNSSMNTTFPDLRFLDSTETTELKYWFENITASSVAYVWVKIPTITASSTEIIYMYYGNPLATSNSDIQTAFLFGDDFTTGDSAWVDPAGVWNVTNDIYSAKSDGAEQTLPVSFSLPANSIIESQVSWGGDGTAGGDEFLTWKYSDASNYYMAQRVTTTNVMDLFVNNGGFTALDTGGGTINADTFYKVQIISNSSGQFIYNPRETLILSSSNTGEAGTNYGFLTDKDSTHSVNWTFVRNHSTSEPTYIIGPELENIAVEIILILPTNNTQTTNTLINFTFQSTPIMVNLTNTTLKIWNATDNALLISNFTTLSGNESVNTTFINNLSQGNYLWGVVTHGTAGTVDTSENRTLTVHTTTPSVTIHDPKPIIDYHLLGANLTLNWTVEETGENLTTHITNCTYEYNGFVTVLNNTLCTKINQTSFLYVNGVNNLTFNVTDILGLVNSTLVEWNFIILEINQTFEENITEGELDDFSLLLNISDASSLTDATFSYNGTNFTTTIIFSSGLYLISSLIVSPTVEADTNFSFNWFFTVDDINYTTTINEQLVINSLFDICGGLSNDTLLNMSLVDEETEISINGTIEIVADITSKSSGVIIGTVNNTFENIEYAAICFSPVSSYPSYDLNTEIKYSSDGYVSELYYIQNSDMSDYPRNLTLFDLNQTDSTEFVVTFQNDAFILVEGAIIQLQRKFIGENVYKVVEAPRTSDGGKAIVHIDLNTNIYRVSVVKDGELLKFFDEVVFNCANELAGECEEQLRGNVDPNNDVPIETITDFSYSVSVSDDNNTVNVLFAIPSGTPSSINVLLEQRDMFGNVTSCNTTVITSAGSITCDFSDTIEKSILQLTISKDGTQLAITNYGVDPELDMDGMNFFIVFLFLISLVGMAIASPEWMMIIGIMVFMISGTLLLLTGMSLAMGLGAMAWLVVAVIIIILKMAKQEDR